MRVLLALALSAAAHVEAAAVRTDDPYARLGGDLSAAVRMSGLRDVAVVPFRTTGDEDDIGGALVAERIGREMAARGGIRLLDGRRLREERAGARRAPDGAGNPPDDVALYGEILKQFAILDLELQQSFDHIQNRKRAAGLIRERLLDSQAGVERLARRSRDEPPEAEAFVTGLLVPLRDGTVEVQARLTEAADSRVLAAVSARVPRDWGKAPPPPPKPPDRLPLNAALMGLGAALAWLSQRIGSG